MNHTPVRGLAPLLKIFSRLIGIPTVPVDRVGEPVAGWPPLLPFCALVQSTPQGLRRCLAGCYREAARARKPELFRCHADLVGFVFPLQSGTGERMSVVGGPVLLRAPDPSRYLTMAEELSIPQDDMIRRVCGLPLGTMDEALRRGRGLFILANSSTESARDSAASREIASGALNLFSSLEAVGGTEAFPDLSAYLLEVISMVFNVESAALALPEEDGAFRCRAVAGTDPGRFTGVVIAPGGTSFGQTVTAGRSVSVTSRHTLLALGFPEDVRSATGIPVAVRREIRGIILILNTRLTPAKKRLLSTFAGMVGLAIENQMLRGTGTRKNDTVEKFLQISRDLLDPRHSEELTDPLLNHMIEILEAERASIMTFDRDTGLLSVRLKNRAQPSGLLTFSVARDETRIKPVLETGEPLLVTNLPPEEKASSPARRYRTDSFVSTPLKVGGKVTGVLNVSDRFDGRPFDGEDLKVLLFMTNIAALVLERNRWKRRSQHLSKLTMMDPLTGLLNRRHFALRLREEMVRTRRLEKSLAFLMADIDHFKHYNDRNGHPAGDEALRLIADAIRSAVRDIDLVARYGGEEFAVILPFTSRPEALFIAERVRRAVEQTPVPFEESQPDGRLTISVGIDVVNGGGGSIDSVVARADKALYRAKAEGRNRVFLHP